MNQTQHTILKRPHFHLNGNDLYFLISKRPVAELSDLELRVWNSFDREISLDELKTKINEPIDTIVRKFVDLDVFDEVASQSIDKRKKVLVVEPHGDDAALSVGGTMWLQRDSCEFTLATIASRSNFTSYFTIDRDYLDPVKVTELRNQEGAQVARMLNGHYLPLNQTDIALRYYNGEWTQDWFRRNRMGVFTSIGRDYSHVELAEWTKTIQQLFKDTDCEEIWIPLGVGPHHDHQLTRDACLSVLLKQPALLSEKSIKFYLEVPYAARHPRYSQAIVDALRAQGANLVEESVPIEAVFAEKLRLISVYGSQFKIQALLPDIEAIKTEKLWKIESLPSNINFDSLSISRDAVVDARQQLRKIDAKSVRRLRILLLAPTGRWRKDVDQLKQHFPNAEFEVYVSETAVAETLRIEEKFIHYYVIPAGSKSWLKLAFRFIFASPAVTLFVTGEHRLKAGKMLARLWPLSRTIVVSSMDHILKGLKET